MSSELNYGHALNRVTNGNKWADHIDSFYPDAAEYKAAFDSSDGGINNDVYGVALYNSVNLSTNLYGAMPKIDATSGPSDIDNPRPRSFRVPHSPPSVSDVGEGGSVPAGQKYAVEEVSATPKRDPLVFESSVLQEIKSQIADGLGLDELTPLGEEYLNRSIERDGLAATVAAGGTQYDAENNITSIDRVVASGDEESNAQDSTDTAYSAGDLDVYDIDRSSDSWGDAYVDHNGTSGDRQLTSSLVDGFLGNLVENGTATWEDLVIFTGYDTARVLSDLRDDSARYMADTGSAGRDQVGDNGQSRYGVSATKRLRDWDGIPIVPVVNMPSDTLSRIYALDFSDKIVNGQNLGPKIGIEQYMAPYVEQSGQNQAQGFLATGEFKNKALYLMYHELVCRDFGAQGKLRDLSE